MPIRDRRLALEYRPLAGLIPFTKNARTHSDEHVAQIAVSIREVGWTESEGASRPTMCSAPVGGAG
jgi:hypothetical protein